MILKILSDMEYEDLCLYDTAVQLRNKGFDWPCHHHYTRGQRCLCNYIPENFNVGNVRFISAPSLSQTRAWFRLTKGIDIIVDLCADTSRVLYGVTVYNQGVAMSKTECKFLQYDSAVQLGITKALELI